MKKILLVTDDPFILQSYQDGLAQQGFQVDTASDGLEAVKNLRAEPNSSLAARGIH